MEMAAHRTRAVIAVDAPAREVYRTLTDVAGWPVLYPWICHTEVERLGPDRDLSRFWAVRPGPVPSLRIWESRRRLDDTALRMEFEQLGSVGTITALGGTWTFHDDGGGCLVESRHWFTADGDPDAVVAELDRHGGLQMRTLKAAVEGRARAELARVAVDRSAVVAGTLDEVYTGLLRRAGGSDGQGAELVTAHQPWPDDSDRAVPSVVVGRPGRAVLLKSLQPPEGLSLYRRLWQLREVAGGVEVTAQQLAVLAEADAAGRERIGAWLGERAAADLLAPAPAR